MIPTADLQNQNLIAFGNSPLGGFAWALTLNASLEISHKPSTGAIREQKPSIPILLGLEVQILVWSDGTRTRSPKITRRGHLTCRRSPKDPFLAWSGIGRLGSRIQEKNRGIIPRHNLENLVQGPRLRIPIPCFEIQMGRSIKI